MFKKIYIYCDVVLLHAQRLFKKSLIFGNLEQRINHTLHWIWIVIPFMLLTHGAPRDPPAWDHRPVDGDQYSRHGRDFRAMEGITRHGTTKLQHTAKRILGASGGCESRLLKNTKERSSPSLCWQFVNKLTCAMRLIPVIATWRR